MENLERRWPAVNVLLLCELRDALHVHVSKLTRIQAVCARSCNTPKRLRVGQAAVMCFPKCAFARFQMKGFRT